MRIQSAAWHHAQTIFRHKGNILYLNPAAWDEGGGKKPENTKETHMAMRRTCESLLKHGAVRQQWFLPHNCAISLEYMLWRILGPYHLPYL